FHFLIGKDSYVLVDIIARPRLDGIVNNGTPFLFTFPDAQGRGGVEVPLVKEEVLQLLGAPVSFDAVEDNGRRPYLGKETAVGTVAPVIDGHFRSENPQELLGFPLFENAAGTIR